MRILLLILFSVNCTICFAQKNKSSSEKNNIIIQKTKKINSLLAIYSTLSPFSDDDNRFNKIDSIRNEIVKDLLVILNDPGIKNYVIEELITEPGLSITKSSDNKIYFFSIDEKTGGSYRTNVTLIHYRLPDGSVKGDYFGDDVSEALTTSGYRPVQLVDSLNKRYVTIGSVITCNTCLASVFIMLQLDSSAVSTQLIDQFDGRYYDLKAFDYNSDLKEFYCEYQQPEYDDETENVKRVTIFKNRFRYIAGEFVEVENCVYVEIP